MPTLSGEATQVQGTETIPETSTEAVEPAAPAAAATAAAGDTDRWAGIPEEWAWARGAVEAANREAASRRVALRELEEKTKDAKTPEEFTAAIEAAKAAEDKLALELARERSARTHGLTDELLEFLTGTDAEAIEAQAAKLAALQPAAAPVKVITQPPLSGGSSPSQANVEIDGRKAWAKYREKNRR